MRILHCPTPVCGNPHGLSAGEKSLGHNSETLAFCHDTFDHPIEKTIWNKTDFFLIKEYKRWRKIFNVMKHYDVIHYNSGMSLAPKKLRGSMHGIRQFAKSIYNTFYASLFSGRDVKMANRNNIVTAVTYQGSDARLGDYCREHYDIHFCHENPSIYDAEHDRLNREMMDFFDHHADLIYAVNPDLLNVLPKRAKFMPYTSVNYREWNARPINPQAQEPLHIVHAPSNRTVKGTKYILDAFAKLQSEGIPFRYTLIEDMPYVEAKKAYETADILIDQLLAGYYGALTVEFMAMAKPVICYMREEDLHYMPDQMVKDMPIINATPDSLFEVLKDTINTDRQELSDIGLAGRRYVEDWHDPVKIAQERIYDYESILNKKAKS